MIMEDDRERFDYERGSLTVNGFPPGQIHGNIEKKILGVDLNKLEREVLWRLAVSFASNNSQVADVPPLPSTLKSNALQWHALPTVQIYVWQSVRSWPLLIFPSKRNKVSVAIITCQKGYNSTATFSPCKIHSNLLK
ncbi:hypothetical protein NC653_001433 [Populus alba x Populus x berolinensis]|uniref:Uncharacterized protein n=2 Tax=Populus TaxID=3689 RepID=A0A4U5NSQ1_POPAL|nr:hypothetical protein NC653_001433 [Populus alba x Populus x berolinensis]TKR85983.1 hypothetical protein D5086_0000242630 [Populus alba]